MTTPDPRDRALEATLRRGMPGSGPASADCLDAETLAAWADGTLEANAMAHAEAHMADCARCQAVMAAIVATPVEPATANEAPGGATGRTWWPFDLRWLVPLAGAAAALVVWMVVPGRGPDQVARLEDRGTDATAPTFRAAPPPPQAAEGVPQGTPGASLQALAPPAGARAKEAAPRQEVAAAPPTDDRAETRASADAAAATRANELELQRRRAADAVVPERSADAIAGIAAPAAPASPAPPPPAAVAAAPVEREAARLDAPPPPLGKSVGSMVADNRLAAMSGIVSNDPAVRWRFAGPGIVERSRNAGVSWERLDTGVATRFTAGASPAPDVCWIVGEGGTVLLTTDARTWRRLASPTAENLIGVEAASDRRATIRSATERFQTLDGGATWARIP